METTKKGFDEMNISAEKVLSLVGELFGRQGNPDPDNPLPPGPWDPYIRIVAEKFGLFSPAYQPWQNSLYYRLHSDIWNLIHPPILDNLNPQPLPPRSVFLASLTQEVITHALLVEEIADAINQKNSERSIIIVSGTFGKFADEIDELCPRIVRVIIKHPPKGDDGYPRPNWENGTCSATELFSVATVFQQNSEMTINSDLRRSLQHAGLRLVEMGVARL